MSNRLPILAAQIRQAHDDVGVAARTSADRAIDAGKALIEAKALCGHGHWMPWLRDNCGISDRTARLYMQLAKSDLKSATVANMGIKAAAKALAKPASTVPSRFICLPEQSGCSRLGLRRHFGGLDVLFITEDAGRGGYYWPLHTSLPSTGVAETSWLKKPIRAEAVAAAIEVMEPDVWADVSAISWRDVPRDHLGIMAEEMESFFGGINTGLNSWRAGVH